MRLALIMSSGNNPEEIERGVYALTIYKHSSWQWVKTHVFLGLEVSIFLISAIVVGIIILLVLVREM